jgi:hypothetical protein
MSLIWTAAPVTVQGPRKGESSSRSMRNGLRSQPALSVRGSSRRIMSMRFRPANIRVINRRASFWAVIGSAVQNRRLKAHQQERVPVPPPVEISGNATAVLAGKGTLRGAKSRALACCAPLWPGHLCDGRLRREHFARACAERGRPSSLYEERRPDSKTTEHHSRGS